jgi:hypothetical protein
MYKNATKCNETIGKWCKNKHGASKIIDTFETYHGAGGRDGAVEGTGSIEATGGWIKGKWAGDWWGGVWIDGKRREKSRWLTDNRGPPTFRLKQAPPLSPLWIGRSMGAWMKNLPAPA